MLWWFAQTSLIVAALAVVAALASRSKRLGPESRHALWLVVLCKFLIPPIVAWPWSVPDAWPVAQPEAAEVVAPTPSPPLVSLEPGEPLTIAEAEAEVPIEPEASMPLDLRTDPVREPGIVAEPTSLWKPEILKSGITDLRITWPALVLAAWVLGSVVVVARRGLRIARFERSLRTADPAPEWLMEQTRSVGDRLGVSVPRVVMTSAVATPLLWCLGRPRLVVPESLAKTLPHDRWPGILAHELAHLARRDHWVVRVDLVVEALWWWNPLFSLVRRQVREQAELACDARVVRDLPERRFAYAEALVEVCEHLSRASNPMPALGVVEPRASRSLEGRLLMILREPAPRRSSRSVALIAATLLALALPSWTLGQQGPPQDPARPVEAARGQTPAPPPVAPSKPVEAEARSFIKPSEPTFSLEEIDAEVKARRTSVMNLAVWYILTSQATSNRHGADRGHRRVQIQAADVVITRTPRQTQRTQHFVPYDRNSRIDVIEARGPRSGAEGLPWSRRLEFRSPSDLSSLRTDSSQSGPVPLRWRDISRLEDVQVQASSSSFSAGFSGVNWLPMDDADQTIAINPPDHRVLNALDLEWPQAWASHPGWAQVNVAGSEVIDGRETLRLAWIDGQVISNSGMTWIAPGLGFATVRTEAVQVMGDPDDGRPHKRSVTRKQASDFTKVGNLWLPGQVSSRWTSIAADGQTERDCEQVIRFENYRVNLPPDAEALKFARPTPEQDPATGTFRTTPPPLASGLVDRLEKAVRESPFGPPMDWTRLAEPPTPPVALTSKPQPAEVVADQPASTKAESDVVQALRDKLIQDLNSRQTVAMSNQLRVLQGQLDEIKRKVKDENDPALVRAQKKYDALKNQLNEIPAAKLKQDPKELTERATVKRPDAALAGPSNANANANSDAVALAQARRNGKAAEVQKAEAQKKLAMAVVQRNRTLREKGPNFVSQEEILKAEAELAIAEAELARTQADLAEADLIVEQAGRRPATVAGAVATAPASLAEARDAIELAEAQLQGKRAELHGSEAKVALTHAKINYIKVLVERKGVAINELILAEADAKVPEAELEQKKAEVLESEIRLKQAKRRVEAEEARLKRLAVRAKAEFDRAEVQVKTGKITLQAFEAARDKYDDVMFQLDPNHIPTPNPERNPVGKPGPRGPGDQPGQKPGSQP